MFKKNNNKENVNSYTFKYYGTKMYNFCFVFIIHIHERLSHACKCYIDSYCDWIYMFLVRLTFIEQD